MIFNKSVYSPSNFFTSFVKRFKLVTFLRSRAVIEYNEVIRKIPFTSSKLDLNSINELNEICHVQAFEKSNNQVSIDISVCNSCGDCTKYSGSKVTMKELSRKEIGLINLDLCRDE